LLVTVNNRLKFEIEIVHDLSCHPIRTKFEVSISTHYEDMKDDTKCRKWGGLG